MLAEEAVELVIGAGAAGVLAGLLGDGVGGRLLGVLLAELPDGGEPGLIAEGVDGVPHAVDADPEGRARAVTDGGRGRADGGAQHLLQWTWFVSSKKLADPAPWVLIAPAGPLFFRAEQPGPGPPLYQNTLWRGIPISGRVSQKPRKTPRKPLFCLAVYLYKIIN